MLCPCKESCIKGRVGDRQWRLDLCAVCIWLIHSAICMFYTCAERMIGEGRCRHRDLSAYMLCCPCPNITCSLPLRHNGEAQTTRWQLPCSPASYGCKDLLPSVACYFSLFLTHIRHCCIFANRKRQTPSALWASPPLWGDYPPPPPSGTTPVSGVE